MTTARCIEYVLEYISRQITIIYYNINRMRRQSGHLGWSRISIIVLFRVPQSNRGVMVRLS